MKCLKHLNNIYCYNEIFLKNISCRIIIYFVVTDLYIIVSIFFVVCISLSYITSAKKASVIGKDGKSSSVGARDLPTTLSNSAWSIFNHSGFSDRKRNIFAKVSLVVFNPAKKRSRHSTNKFSPAVWNMRRTCVNSNLLLTSYFVITSPYNVQIYLLIWEKKNI